MHLHQFAHAVMVGPPRRLCGDSATTMGGPVRASADHAKRRTHFNVHNRAGRTAPLVHAHKKNVTRVPSAEMLWLPTVCVSGYEFAMGIGASPNYPSVLTVLGGDAWVLFGADRGGGYAPAFSPSLQYYVGDSLNLTMLAFDATAPHPFDLRRRGESGSVLATHASCADGPPMAALLARCRLAFTQDLLGGLEYYSTTGGPVGNMSVAAAPSPACLAHSTCPAPTGPPPPASPSVPPASPGPPAQQPAPAPPLRPPALPSTPRQQAPASGNGTADGRDVGSSEGRGLLIAAVVLLSVLLVCAFGICVMVQRNEVMLRRLLESVAALARRPRSRNFLGEMEVRSEPMRNRLGAVASRNVSSLLSRVRHTTVDAQQSASGSACDRERAAAPRRPRRISGDVTRKTAPPVVQRAKRRDVPSDAVLTPLSQRERALRAQIGDRRDSFWDMVRSRHPP